jgi:hypothetical protein
MIVTGAVVFCLAVTAAPIVYPRPFLRGWNLSINYVLRPVAWCLWKVTDWLQI